VRAELAFLCVLGCGTLAGLTRPEGDGGWSPGRRREEIEERGAAAGVAVGPGRAQPPGETAAPLPPGRLDLPTALDLAAHGNRRIAGAERQVGRARERVVETRGRLLPAVTGSGRYTWYTDPLMNNVRLPPGLVPPGAQPAIRIRDAQFGVVNGTATVPIDYAGEIGHALAAAQAGYRGESARLWATTLEQEVAVIRAYFELLEAERLREVTLQTLALDRQQLASAESRYGAGRLTKNELLVVQVALRNAEQALVQRDLAVDEARWALNQVVGLPVDAPTEPVDVERRPAVPATEEALAAAWANNPVLAALLEEQQRLEATTTALVRGRLPRFSAGGTIDYSTSDLIEPQRVGSGFVGFTWDLGTDQRREAEIAEARIAADQNRIEIERQLRELEAAVRASQGAAAERLLALDTAEAAVHQAEENLRIRREQFDEGRATSDDVLDAEAILAAQRATLASALYEAHTRRAELQQLMGLPLAALVSGEQ
jgi:outer membrane protein TolC